jgi:RNA polymerase sigma-70 factor (ECF subfamily)
MLNNAQDAEDVTQTVFFNAFLKLRTYDPRYRFFSWVYRMAVNESLNMLKRRKQTVTLEDEPIPVPGATTDDATELQDRVGSALMGLKPDDRAVVVLKHFMFFSYEEIAAVLEIPVKTVKSRLFTARERLRDTLRERVQKPC